MTPAERVLAGLESRARRTELAAALARTEGIRTDDAARVMWAELGDLAEEAGAAGLDHLAGLATAARDVCRQAAALTVPEPRRDVLVLDDSEVTRDLVVIAIEAQGHAVRVASNLGELAALFRVRRPDLILTEAAIGQLPPTDVCAALRGLIGDHWVPTVLFSGASDAALATMALNIGADRYVSKDQGIGSLIRELNEMFEEILW
jgi:PleD family two-component response regulator